MTDSQSKHRSNEPDPAGTEDRLAALEARILELERIAPIGLATVSVLRTIEAMMHPVEDIGDIQQFHGLEHGHAVMMGYLAREAGLNPGSLRGRRLVEIGCTRELSPRQGSTQKFALFTSMFGMKFDTVDMNPQSIAAVDEQLWWYSSPFSTHVAKGEDFLASYPQQIDYVYLDAFDIDHGQHDDARQADYQQYLGTQITREACAQMHLDCARALVGTLENGRPRLAPDGLVIFDDSWESEDGEFTGKGETAIPFMFRNGFRIVGKAKSTIAMRRLMR